MEKSGNQKTQTYEKEEINENNSPAINNDEFPSWDHDINGDNSITTMDIAAVAANSVNGFLTNIAKGVRRAHAEGGKGTRRRVELYVSSDLPTKKEAKNEEDSKAAIKMSAVNNNTTLFDLDEEEDNEGKDENFAFGNDDSGVGDFYEGDEDWDEFDLNSEMISTKTELKGDPNINSSSTVSEQKVYSVTKKEAAQLDSTLPPPPLPPAMGIDIGYEQMMAERQAAVANARNLRLTSLKRNVNTVAAEVIKGQIISRWAAKFAFVVQNFDSTESNLSKAFIKLKHAFTEIAASLPHPTNYGVKPTHAPSWITPDKDTSGSNPFGKAVFEFISSVSSFVNVIISPTIENPNFNLSKDFFEQTCGQFKSLWDEKDSSSGISIGGKRERDECEPENADTVTGVKETNKSLSESEYVTFVLSLFKAAGIAARLAMATEAPRHPLEAQVAFDVVDGENEIAQAKSSTHSNAKVCSGNVEAKAAAAQPPSPSAHCWIEVWDPLRRCVVSVNPFRRQTTRFGAPYTFAFASTKSYRESGEHFVDELVCDVTPRYVAKYSSVYSKRLDKQCAPYKKLLWPDTFLNQKDYLTDPSHGPMQHLLFRVNQLLNGNYKFEMSPLQPMEFNNVQSNTTCPSTEWLISAHHALMVSGTEAPHQTLSSANEATCAPVECVSSFVFGAVPEGAISVLCEHNSRKTAQSPAAVTFDPEREATQILKLIYAEPPPTTLSEAKNHPLYVLEKDLGRFEAIYPKDKSTLVGTIRGAFVYKRCAVVSLRSRDGWLRESRSLITDDVQPYRVVPPPPSRPLAHPTRLYGYWQTRPFEPLPLTEKGGIPRHGNTNWYMILGATIPSTLTVVNRTIAAAVARRTNIEYRNAIVGFIKKEWTGPSGRFGDKGTYFGGGYEAKAEGIIVRTADVEKLNKAMDEYARLAEEQEARRRSLRARNWWNAFSQRLLTNDRMHQMFIRGNTLI